MDATQFYINIASYSIYLGSGLTIIILSTPTCNQAILSIVMFLPTVNRCTFLYLLQNQLLSIPKARTLLKPIFVNLIEAMTNLHIHFGSAPKWVKKFTFLTKDEGGSNQIC